jgi:hypothetical protein
LIVDLKKSEYLPGDYFNQSQDFEQVNLLLVLVQSGTTGGGGTQLQNRGAVATGSTLRNASSAYD